MRSAALAEHVHWRCTNWFHAVTTARWKHVGNPPQIALDVETIYQHRQLQEQVCIHYT